MADKSEFTKDPAIGYLREYTDKKTNQKRKYIRIMLDTEVLGGLTSPDGKIYLAGFRVLKKKKGPKSPDYVFKLSDQATKETQNKETATDDDVPF